jgi:hypothetical protein
MYLEEELCQPSPDSLAAVAEALAEIKAARAHRDLAELPGAGAGGNAQRTPQDLGAAVTAWAAGAGAGQGAWGDDPPEAGGSAWWRCMLHCNWAVNLMHNAFDAMPQGGD